MSSCLNMCFCVHNKQEDICECQCFEGQLTVIYTQSIFALSPVGRCEWTSCAAGVCSKWCRQSEASRFLPGMQSNRAQHHCLQGGGHWRHHCYRDPSGAQQWYDTRVRGEYFVEKYQIILHSVDIWEVPCVLLMYSSTRGVSAGWTV